jgi:mono/diheme cytochrome c family protein
MASGGKTGSGGVDASVGGSGGSIGDGGPDASSDGGDADRVARGAYLVRSAALCGGCHTASGGAELGGNPAFGKGLLPAPNLTPDPATGLGTWTDQEMVNAIRNGVDDEGRHLNSAMPYWLFHNMTDADAMSIVAFLRSLPPVSAMAGDAALGSKNPDATPLTPLTGFPASSLQPGDADYEAAQAGKYLASSVAQCVKCHSPASGGLPTSFFSGAAPTSSTQIFASNLTPDPTGLGAGDAGPAWTAADIATALKLGKDKNGVALCGSMPSGVKGYGGLTDADANAIGVYLTTIPGVAHPEASPSLEPACP